MVLTTADGQVCDLADVTLTIHVHGSRTVLMAHSPHYPPVVVRADDTLTTAAVQMGLHDLIRRLADQPRRDR